MLASSLPRRSNSLLAACLLLSCTWGCGGDDNGSDAPAIMPTAGMAAAGSSAIGGSGGAPPAAAGASAAGKAAAGTSSA
ncbi:MAG TPA: hypothetical protein VJR89_07885, partial [Polyangiales bacterium]|nr:hypothetical protein [Polyangiales bacterium]